MATQGLAAGYSVDQWLSGQVKTPAQPTAIPSQTKPAGKGLAAGKSVEDWLKGGAKLDTHSTGIMDTATTFAGNVASNLRDFGDMIAGGPAMLVKGAVESAVSAYKMDPNAGVKAGEELANNPIFKPWLTPLKSFQEAIEGKQVGESGLAHVSNSLLGTATEAAKKAGEKAGIPAATTQIVIDDLMGTLGLKGMHEIAKGITAKVTAPKVAPKAAPTPEEPVPIPKEEPPKPPMEQLKPQIDSALQAHAQDILDGKIPQGKADAALRKSPQLVETVKQVAARRADARAALGEIPEPTPKPEPALPPKEVIKTRLTDGLKIGPDMKLEEKPALDRAVEKIKAGKRFDMTSEEKVAWNKSPQRGGVGLEVPSKQGGFADPEVLKKLGIVAGGAVLFNYLDPQDTWKSYATGAALGLAGVWAAPHIREGLKADTRLRIDKYVNDFEAASQLAKVRAHQFVQGIQKALPDEKDQAAVTYALDEGRPPATPEQAKVYSSVQDFFRTVGEEAKKHGVVKELRDNYVTHLWDTPINRSRFGSALTTTSPFAKARTFTTLAEGKAAGLVPRTENIADIAEAYADSMNRAIQGKVFIDTLKGLQGPDGRPLIAKVDGAPRGYVPVDLPQLRGSLVHPDIAQSLSMLESGRLQGPLQVVSETMQAVKRVKVVGSLFHLKTLGEVALGSREVGKILSTPKRMVNFAMGKDDILRQLNEGGMGKDVEDLIKGGTTFSLERGTPGVEDIGGSFYEGMTNAQNWLDEYAAPLAKGSKAFIEANHKLDTLTWARFQTGWKFLVGSETMHRLEENGVPREKAAEIASNFVNTQFGGLNWRRIAEGARSRWGRDVAMAMLHPKMRTVSQIMMFAPDWTVSTIRQITQAMRRSGGPLEQAKGLFKPTELADLHRLALVRGAVYYLMVGDAVNYMMSGHHIWQNKNPLRIDLGDGQTMIFSKHLTEPLEWFHQPARTAAGKLSYLPSEAIDQLTGKEYIGGPPMMENRVVHAAKGLLPFPAEATGPKEALAGMAGFPIYGHTREQMREIKRERYAREHTPEAIREREKKRRENQP